MNEEPAVREKAVPLIVQITRTLAEEVHKLAEELEQFLGSVLRPSLVSPGVAGCEEDKAPAPSCELESQVRGLAEVLANTKELLQDIVDRLEV